MAFTTLTTINSDFEQAGASGELFLVDYPSGGWTGLDNAAKVAAIMAEIYADGTKRDTTTASPWGNITADGVEVKAKSGTIDADPLSGSKHPIALLSPDVTVDFSIYDIDQAHIANACSVETGDVLTQAAGTGQYAYKTSLLGAQRNLRKFAVVVRVASPTVVGKYDHHILPKAVMVPDLDIKINKKDPLSAKLTLTAIADRSILAANGQPTVWIHDVATAAASA